MERVVNRDFNWVNYNNYIIGYDNEKNIFYKFNVFNNLVVSNILAVSNIVIDSYKSEILLISNKELDFLLELRSRILPSFETSLSLEKYFNRIKVLNNIL